MLGMRKTILDKDIDSLKEVDINTLISFHDEETELNAFIFACVKDCGYEVISLILDRAVKEYFSKAIEASAASEFKNFNSEDNEEIDIEECGEIGQEFFNFFYSIAEYEGMELNAAALALKHEDFETVNLIMEKLYLAPVHDDFLTTKTARELTFVGLTNKHGDKQSSRFSSKVGISTRPPRKFHGEREKQLLKQLSTILFFYIKANNDVEKLTEVETLHIRIGNVSHLVIACNGGDKISPALNDLNYDKLKKILTENIAIKGKGSKEGKIRIDRYQNNFTSIFRKKKGIYFEDKSEHKKDLNKYQNIIEVLRDHLTNIKVIDNYLLKQKNFEANGIFDSETSCIIFINNEKINIGHSDYGRHAEEYLVDFFKVMLKYKTDNDLSTSIDACIAGKKRPCFTCYGTMFNMGISRHGERPGYGWKASLHGQDASNAKITLLSIAGNASYVTLEKDGNSMTDFDSGSDDDEIESEKKVYTI